MMVTSSIPSFSSIESHLYIFDIITHLTHTPGAKARLFGPSFVRVTYYITLHDDNSAHILYYEVVTICQKSMKCTGLLARGGI